MKLVGRPSRSALLLLLALLLGGCSTGGSAQEAPTSTPASQYFGSELVAATCATAHHCIAVGRTRDAGSGRYQTLIEETTGGGWSVVPSPNDVADGGSQLTDVSCSDQSHCLAVGFSLDA